MLCLLLASSFQVFEKGFSPVIPRIIWRTRLSVRLRPASYFDQVDLDIEIAHGSCRSPYVSKTFSDSGRLPGIWRHVAPEKLEECQISLHSSNSFAHTSYHQLPWIL